MSGYPRESFKVLTTLAAQLIVQCTAENTVVLASAASDAILGVTHDTVAEINQAIEVTVFGREKLLFNDTVAAGAPVSSNAAGQGVPFSGVTSLSYIVGYNIGAAVAATATVSEIFVNPAPAWGSV